MTIIERLAGHGSARLPDGAPCAAHEGQEVPHTVDLMPTSDLDVRPGQNLRVHFRVHNASFELEGTWRRRSGRVQVGPDLTVFSANRRRSPRLPMNGAAVVSGIGRGALPLVDAGPSGFQIRAPSGTDVAIGTYGFSEIAIADQVFEGYARVRRSAPRDADVGIGVEFEPLGSRQEWVRALLANAYPAMRPRATAGQAEVLRLLDDAGYLQLTKGEVPQGWHEFSRPGSFDLVYRAADDRLVANLSVTRAFSSTWIFHQLAGVPGHAESFASRYAMYAMLSQIPPLMDGARAHALAYFNPNLAWHRRYVDSFGEWMGSVADVDIGLADRFHLDTSNPLGIAAPGAVVTSLRPEDRRMVFEIASANWTPLVARAFDISPSTLEFEPNVLGRSRTAFVLRRAGEPVAIALAERGDPSMSLFGMFDIVHVLPRHDVAPAQAELNLLIEHVRRWYRGQGVQRPIVATPQDTIERGRHPAATFVETMGRFVLSPRGLRHYENFLHYTFGEYARAVDQRKEGIRNAS